MLISDQEAQNRLKAPGNLFNLGIIKKEESTVPATVEIAEIPSTESEKDPIKELDDASSGTEVISASNNLVPFQKPSESESLRNDVREAVAEHTDKSQHKKIHAGGRQEGDHNLTDEMREAVIQFSATGDHTNAVIAKVFDISEAQVSNILHGKKTHSGPQESNLLKVKADVKTRVHESALEKTLAAMDIITPDMLKGAGIKTATELSKIASNLSQVADRTSAQKHKGNIAQFIIMKGGGGRKKKEYEVVDVEARVQE